MEVVTTVWLASCTPWYASQRTSVLLRPGIEVKCAYLVRCRAAGRSGGTCAWSKPLLSVQRPESLPKVCRARTPQTRAPALMSGITSTYFCYNEAPESALQHSIMLHFRARAVANLALLAALVVQSCATVHWPGAQSTITVGTDSRTSVTPNAWLDELAQATYAHNEPFSVFGIAPGFNIHLYPNDVVTDIARTRGFYGLSERAAR